MDRQRKLARDYLIDASLVDYRYVVLQAKISDEDQKILDLRFIHGLTTFEIAQQCYCSEEKVKAIIRKAYNKVSKLLGY